MAPPRRTRWIARPRGVAVLVLVTLVALPLVVCRPVPTPTGSDTLASPAPVSNTADEGASALEPPVVLVNYEGNLRPAEGTVLSGPPVSPL